MKPIIKKLPLIYLVLLIGILFIQNINTDPMPKGALVLGAVILLCLIQMLKPNRIILSILATITSFFAIWMALAWYSDLINGNGPANWSFIIGGLLFVSMNFIMAVLLWMSGFDDGDLVPKDLKLNHDH